MLPSPPRRLRHTARFLDPDIRSAEEILLAGRFRFDGVVGVIGTAIDVDDPTADADRISCHMRAGRFLFTDPQAAASRARIRMNRFAFTAKG